MAFDSDKHPRAAAGSSEGGRFVRAAGAPDSRVVDVPGDEWNKTTAKRLEDEYTAALPDIENIVKTIEQNEDNAEAKAHNALLTSAFEKLNGPELPPLHDWLKQITDEETAALIGEYGSLADAYSELKNGPPKKDAMDDADETHAPEDWSEVNPDDQEAVKDKWMEDKYESFYDDEVNNYQENDGPAEAAHLAAEDEDWKADQIGDMVADRIESGDPRFPYTADQLMNAVNIDFDRDNAFGNSLSWMEKHSDDFLHVTFDDSKLQEPNNASTAQATLPGIEPKKMSDALTPEMREYITDWIKANFWEHAEKKTSDVETPDYLSDSTKESMENYWDEMSDSDKFKYADKNTTVLDDYKQQNKYDKDQKKEFPLIVPARFDPLQGEGGPNYQATQRFANYVADHRAAELIKQRMMAAAAKASFAVNTDYHEVQVMVGGLRAKNYAYPNEWGAEEALADVKKKWAESDAEGWAEQRASPVNVEHVDSQLWQGWKSSSSGNEGRVIQIAAAQELGGRLRSDNRDTPAERGGTPEFRADKIFAGTEWVLRSPTGQKTTYESQTEAENALALVKKQDPTIADKWDLVPVSTTDKTQDEGAGHKGYTRLPEINVMRNGASSMTLNRDVANGWGGTPNKGALTPDEAKNFANTHYQSIGGWEGVKALMRAKWEVTQYMLDKSDQPTVQVYRGLTLRHTLDSERQMETPPIKNMFGDELKQGEGGNRGLSSYSRDKDYADNYHILQEAEKQFGQAIRDGATGVRTFKKPSEVIEYAKRNMSNRMSQLAVQNYGSFEKLYQNEAALYNQTLNSTGHYVRRITDPLPGAQRNQPGGIHDRVVLRASLPRTAIVSVPAYGQNIHSEREVIAVGTGWHGWDAWSDKAPDFRDVPMAHVTNSSYAEKANIDHAAVAKAAKEAADKHDDSEIPYPDPTPKKSGMQVLKEKGYV